MKGEIGQIYHRQLRILGSNGGTYQDLVSALALVSAGHLRPVVDAVLPLAQIHEGHRLLEEGQHFGKVVIELPLPQTDQANQDRSQT